MPVIDIHQTFNTALEHHRNGRLNQAEGLYRQILLQQPNHANSLHFLGVLAGQAGRLDSAIDLISRATTLDPANPAWLSNLARFLVDKGRFNDAIAACRRAIALRPDFAEAFINMGNAHRKNGDYDGALALYRQAITLNPSLPEAHANLGIVLRNIGDLDGAVAAYHQALKLRPNFTQALNDLGIALSLQDRFDEAIESFRQALAINPRLADVHNNLAGSLKEIGLPDEAAASYRQALALKPSFLEAHDGLIFTLMYQPGTDAGVSELAAWNRQHAVALKQTIQPHLNDRSPHRPLHIGYVSADFRDHVVARNLCPLFQLHDRQQFEIHAYAHTIREDATTQQLRGYFHQWHDIANVSDDAAAELIRTHQIDILVDLSLHTVGNRLLVFARKPAPIQVTFAGYPGSTGLDTIDYRLTDPFLDPPGGNDAPISEKPIRLPSFWNYEPDPLSPGVNNLPAITKGYVTFGCLNSFRKINTEVIALWAQVLDEVNFSHLLIQVPEGGARQRVRDSLLQRGIDTQHLEFALPRLPRLDYLKLYNRIDVGLDTFPYNGHTTSLDSYWMGVPVVGLAGSTIVGRAGISQLSNLGLPELIADSPDNYVRIARNLAYDLEKLKSLRASLRNNMQSSPLMDAQGFTRAVERAYRDMWKAWISQ